ncbi:hypothetical protein G7Y89_g1030 [Cudoniella acicularis]|uniref:Heterokaryon incompatibility domain-containing protein n=1 Tax=Cudoniella acicularis TaxID=354080 RepID=A0A8H4W7T2_9HELO|nr:hypothetical protein G7Y89_g1030 [Cudoniella acicularis]
MYDCLSYTWGNPLFKKFLSPNQRKELRDKEAYKIDLDGKIMSVTKNLWDALNQLGSSQPPSASSHQRQNRIWIDALCINQEDDKNEKPHQLGMMARIYNQAQNVVVWLGPVTPDDPKLETALLVMDRLKSIPQEKLKTEVLYDLRQVQMYENLGIEPIDSAEWDIFASFILRAWFGRMWVVQEAFFAKNFIIYCGEEIIEWSRIAAASRVLKETRMGRLLNEKVMEATEDEDEDGNEEEDGDENEEKAKVEVKDEDKEQTNSKYISNPISNQFLYTDIRTIGSSIKLERLLAYSRYFGATEDKDRVFAVLNMWKPDWGPSGDKTTSNFIREISTAREAYMRATIVSIRETNDLNMLSLVEDKSVRTKARKEDKLPSWVPDFGALPICEPLAGVPRAAPGQERWNTSEGLQKKWQLPPVTKEPLLSVKGFRIDEIIEFAATDLDIIDEHQMFTLLKILSSFLEADTAHSSRTDAMEPFWKTLIKNTYRGKPAEDDARRAFPYLIAHFVWELDIELNDLQEALDEAEEGDYRKDAKRKFDKFSTVNSDTKSLIEKLSAKENSVIPTWEFIQETLKLANARDLSEEAQNNKEAIIDSFRSAYTCRRLFRTRGNLLGVSAQSLKEGDAVWVVAGAAVPFLLRKLPNGNQELVGEAYVHGIMQGEAVSRQGKSEPQEIHLE